MFNEGMRVYFENEFVGCGQGINYATARKMVANLHNEEDAFDLLQELRK